MKITAKQFAKLFFPMLGLCIVSLAILVSFAVVGGTIVVDPSHNYYYQMNVKEAALLADLYKPPGPNAAKIKKLGLVCWQNNKIEEAEAYLHEVWLEHTSTNRTTYDPVFVEDGLNLAALYIDRGSNELAEEVYQRIIGYDSAHLSPTDPRLGRDYNNLGLSYLHKGEQTPNWPDRKKCFEQALEKFAQAEKIFRLSTQCDQQLVCTLQNQVVAHSELGDDDLALKLSKVVNSRLDEWNSQMTKNAVPNTSHGT